MDHPNFSPLTEDDKHPSPEGSTPDYTRSAALKAALAYAERGQRVFPCGANKAPHTRRGFHDGTTDRSRVHAFWSRWPAARIGLPTGSKFWVLDIDRMQALEELPDELPRTWTVRTPRGGRHLYFAAVEGVTNSPGNLPAGIDVRGTGGYVIAPPSPGYEVVDRTPIASAPAWLIDLIRTRRTPDPQPPRRNDAQPTLDLDGPPILEGSRHSTLLSLAGRLHDGSRTAEELQRDLRSINEDRCTPPLEVEEVAAIATWTASKEPCTSGRPAELEALIDRLSAAWFRLARRGLGGKNEVRMVRVLLEEGDRVGTVAGDGLRISISLRQVAEKLSCSLSTVVAVRDRMAAKGLLRLDRSDLGRRTATGTASAAIVLIDVAATYPVHPTDSLPSRWIGGGVPELSRPHAAALETGHFRHRGPVGYSREDTLCHVEAHPGRTVEKLAGLLGWSRARDLEARHLRPLAELGLIEETGGRWTVADRYAEAQQDAKRIAYSTIQMRSARQWDQKSGRWTHYVAETGSVASQEKREEWDIERHRQQRELWKLALAARKTAAEESCQPGPVIVEDDGDLVNLETGVVVGWIGERRKPPPRMNTGTAANASSVSMSG